MFYFKKKLVRITIISSILIYCFSIQNSYAQVAAAPLVDDTSKGYYASFSNAKQNPTNVKILEIEKQDVVDFLNDSILFPNLENLFICFNTKGNYSKLYQYQSLKNISIQYCTIDFLYKNAASLPNLESFNCLKSNLSNFPTFMVTWKSLKHLNLQGNKITFIKNDIPISKNLTFLSLKNNSLKELPSSFSNLTSLDTLNIGLNQFKEFPTQIFSLTNLKVLSIAFNHIDSIPSDISKLKKLEVLYLTENKITSLPVSMKKMKKLQKVYLSNRQFNDEQKQAIIQALPKKCKVVWTDEDFFNYYHILEF